MHNRARRGLVIWLALVVLSSMACSVPADVASGRLEPVTTSSGPSSSTGSTGSPTGGDTLVGPVPPSERAAPATVPAALPAPSAGGIDHRLFRDDIDCEQGRVDVFADLAFIVAHQVVEGSLGVPCFGDPDERLNQAWRSMVAMTPPDRLHELGMFGGFSSAEVDQTTLAFATSIHDTEPLYAVAVNLEAAVDDPNELALTVAHEFAHVVSTQPNQFDLGIGVDECTTWHNRRGCYRADSLMYRWIEEFWAGDLIRSVVPDAEPAMQTGLQRCRRHRGRFISPYAASHPEEDFAESFSAFVLRTPVHSPEIQARMEWFARQPELAAFRNRAVESGLGPLPNLFQPCR